jgi:hypothetical protein
MAKKSWLAVASCAVVIAGASASAAFAGEVNGNGDPTKAPENANSICAFSGQNDGNPPPGRVQSYGQNVKAGLNDPAHGGFGPGDICQGGSNPDNPPA